MRRNQVVQFGFRARRCGGQSLYSIIKLRIDIQNQRDHQNDAARKCSDLQKQMSDLEPLFICQGCGRRGADVRPNFNWEEEARRATKSGVIDA
jgi:hypothetical protein